MSDLPINESDALPVIITDATTATRQLTVNSDGSLSVVGTQTSATGALNALNAAVTVAIGPYRGAGFTLSAGTLAGTILIEESFDNGTNWIVCYFLEPGTGLITTGNVVTNPNPLIVRTVILDPGATHVRARVSAFTSGTANAAIFATLIVSPRPLSYALNNTLGIVPIRSDAVGNLIPAAANLVVTATAASGTGVTLTLPAVAGQFHYIAAIELTKYFAAANGSSATPLVVTTTNLPGSLAFTFGQPLGTMGASESRVVSLPSPLKSSVVSTASTIVCPATTGLIWRATAIYFTAP